MKRSQYGWWRFASVAVGVAFGFAPQTRADPVLEWNALALDCIRVDNSSPTLSTRNLALLHTAVYDAVNSITRTHQSYGFQLDAPPVASAEAAAVGAAYEVLLSLYPPLEFWADELFLSWFSTVTHDSALTNGLAIGQDVALLVLDTRSADGSSTEVTYFPSTAPGQWQRTPPAFRPPLTPHWRYVDLFCLPELEAFVPGPPPALASAEYATALNEVKAIGGKSSSVRTPEQSQIAVFWSDFSYTAMPPGHWFEIATTIAQAQSNTLAENARMFALLSLAQADAAIVCWEAKYRYNLWRPITAIQHADEDENPATDPDTAWDHFLAAPPFPAYTSGHSTFSKAAAQVLTDFYGTAAVTFTATSDSLPGVTRTFYSLAACADEVGLSRIYGGIHYSFDNREGKACGAKIGSYVFANYLLPNTHLPRLAIERLGAGVRLRLHGHVGRPCVVEATTDLANWSPVSTNVAVPGGMLLELTGTSAEPLRFFRIREE